MEECDDCPGLEKDGCCVNVEVNSILKNSPRPQAPSDEQITIDMQGDHIDSLSGLIRRMREGLQEIYSMRGEDELIAKICDPLIEASRDC